MAGACQRRHTYLTCWPQDDPSGLDVCLYCFNGGCTGDRKHATHHSQLRKHPLVLNIQRTRKKIKVSTEVQDRNNTDRAGQEGV